MTTAHRTTRAIPAGAARTARDTAAAWANGDGCPLAAFAATGAVDDLPALLREIDAALAAVRAGELGDDTATDDTERLLVALREHALGLGERHTAGRPRRRAA